MRRIACCAALVAVLPTATSSLPAERGQVVFKDTMWGVLTGALVGGALTLATDDPADHLSWIGLGAAVGAVAGAAYGMYETTAMAELDRDGELRLAMPSLQLRSHGHGVGTQVDLFRVRF